MPVLVLRLAGPLQSWGVSSNFDSRSSGTEPSKSGVIGMVASAMGRPRGAPLDDLASLRFGVRRDQEGRILTDFHMAHSTDSAYVTRRQYISDAIFLVALEGPRETLEEIDAALHNPYFPLFLGRRSCPPAGKMSLGILEGSLESVLDTYDWQASDWYRRRRSDKVRLEIVSDCFGGPVLVDDEPVSFGQDDRRFRVRSVNRWLSEKVFDNPLGKKQFAGTAHDAMATVREG